MTIHEYARRQRALSIAELSARTRVSGALISLLENGRGTPTPDQARRLARALGVEPEQLLESAPELEARRG